VKIRIKLVSHAGRPIPGLDADGEGEWDMAEDTTVAEALARLDVARETLTMTLVNEEVIRPALQAGHRLKAGDLLTVFPPIEGG